MEFHAVADIFPLMPEADFDLLCADIREHGLLDPIWTHQNKIIDGRNRFLACRQTQTEPRFREWDGTGNLVSFVVSLNLHRRHLSESQRAMVAAKIANMRRGYQDDSNAPIGALLSQTDAAKLLNVSRRSVQRAVEVESLGIPELSEKVESGEMSVSQAAQIAALPNCQQKRLIRRGRLSGQKILNKLKIRSLKKIQEKSGGCLVCNPEAEANKETVSAFMQILSKRHPKFRTYFQSVVDEIEEMELSDEAIAAREKIISAIEMGFQTRAEIQSKTKIENALLDHTIAVMLDYSQIYPISQGGKTDGARGARKTLYFLTEETGYEPDEELVEEFV